MAKRYIKDTELSEELGIPVSTLRADRQNQRRIPFIKLGRSVLYDLDEATKAVERYMVGGERKRRAA